MLNISFDFDEVTHKVTNVIVKDTEGKTVKPKTKKSDIVNSSQPYLIVLENKLVLNDLLLEKLNATAGDRISINYYTVNNETTFPLIGKSEAFADKESGNKLTKSNTVAYRGKARRILLEYGEEFTIEEFKEGIFKLITVKQCELVTEEKELEDLSNPDELDIEIENILNSDVEDDLPF